MGKHRYKVEQLLNQEAETELRGAFTRELSTIPVQLSEATVTFFTDPGQDALDQARVDPKAKTLRLVRDDGSTITNEDVMFKPVMWRVV